MLRSESTAKVAAALAAAQAEIESIGKDSTNPHFRNRYASLDAIMATVRPILARHGIAVVQGVTLPETDGARLVGMAVETQLVHASGEWIGSQVFMPVAKSDPQGAGSAITYGRRYGISAALALATDDDDDGNQASRPTARPQERTQEPTRKSAVEQAKEAAAAVGARMYGAVPPPPAATKPVKLSLAEAEAMQVKGKAIGEMDAERLDRLHRWAQEQQHAKLIAACELVMAARLEADRADDTPPAPEPSDNALPF